MIGAMKCGTNTFHHYLSRHPGVASPREREVHFFDYRWHLGVGWYRASFPRRRSLSGGRITGESTPYYIFHPRVPSRVAEVLPDVRLIALLRDPVERAFSHYRRQVGRGTETLSFEDALKAEESRLDGAHEGLARRDRWQSVPHQAYSYRSRGLYAEQLKRWYDRFDRDSILVLRSEDLFATPATVLRRVERFLGLPEVDLGPLPHLGSGPPCSMRPETRSALQEFYEPHNRSLCRLLGWESAW